MTDRCVSGHEYLFLLAKSERYYFDHEAIKEQGTGRKPGNKNGWTRPEQISRGGRGQVETKGYERRNRRSVWTVLPTPFRGAHFATMPTTLVEPCVLAGSRRGGVVLDPFSGAGTTGLVARRLGRKFVGVEINPDYAKITNARWRSEGVL